MQLNPYSGQGLVFNPNLGILGNGTCQYVFYASIHAKPGFLTLNVFQTNFSCQIVNIVVVSSYYQFSSVYSYKFSCKEMVKKTGFD